MAPIWVTETILQFSDQQLRDALAHGDEGNVSVPTDQGTEIVMTRAAAAHLLAMWPTRDQHTGNA